jgi:hypothetical protein
VGWTTDHREWLESKERLLGNTVALGGKRNRRIFKKISEPVKAPVVGRILE